MSAPNPTVACPRCQQPFAIDAFLAAATGYATATDSGGSCCPRCGEALEFRVGNGTLSLGYTYWSGSLHFEAVVDASVPGLRQQREGARVSALLGGGRFDFPLPGGPAVAGGP